MNGAALLIMAQNWLWGSQIAVKRNINISASHFCNGANQLSKMVRWHCISPCQKILQLKTNLLYNTVHNFKLCHFFNWPIFKHILYVNIKHNHNVSTNILRDHLFQTVSYSGQVKLKFQDIYCQQEFDQLHLLCKFYVTIYQEFMVVFDRWIIFSKHMQSIFWIIAVRCFFKSFSNLFLNIFINISGPYLI